MPSNKDRLYVALYARGGQARMPGGEDKLVSAAVQSSKFSDEITLANLLDGERADITGRSLSVPKRRPVPLQADVSMRRSGLV